MGNINISIDGQTVSSEEKDVLLDVCLENGIYIPHLCHIYEKKTVPASCRLCFVAIGENPNPVPACTVRVQEGMAVRTDTPEVRRLQRSALKLLLCAHEIKCRDCEANKQCALQDIAKFLKVPLKPGSAVYLREKPLDETHPYFVIHHNRCVLCGKCTAVCRSKLGKSMINFFGRGMDTIVSFLGVEEEAADSCERCMACVEICPVHAILPRDKFVMGETSAA